MSDAIRDRARQPVRAVVGHLGFDVLRRSYYSPVPDVDGLPADVWSRRSPMAGVPFDTATQLDYLQNVLAAYIGDFTPPTIPGAPKSFYDNTTYASVDAEVLWAMIRARKPRKVLELGAGVSTMITAAACAANAEDGAPAEFVTCDPFTPPFLSADLPGLSSLQVMSATDVPLDWFTGLSAGDILFVDTTHTVKVNGDVNYLILDVLPHLEPGVLVHFHDIFLPWEYPRALYEHGFFWAEQYLLHAFLACNPLFGVVLSAHALAREWPQALEATVPSFSGPAEVRPSAFWIERSAGGP